MGAFFRTGGCRRLLRGLNAARQIRRNNDLCSLAPRCYLITTLRSNTMGAIPLHVWESIPRAVSRSGCSIGCPRVSDVIRGGATGSSKAEFFLCFLRFLLFTYASRRTIGQPSSIPLEVRMICITTGFEEGDQIENLVLL